MSVPELPYSLSDHPLYYLRKTTKSIDELCSDINKLHQRDQTVLRNSKLQMQPQAVPVSDFSILTKPTSRNTVASSYMAPYPSVSLDSVGVIVQGLRGPSNHQRDQTML